MATSTTYRIDRKSIVAEEFEDEVIILNFESGNYYSIDQTGSRIWSRLDSPATLPQLIDGIMSFYDADRVDVERGIAEFLDKLTEEKLVLLSKVEMRGDLPAPMANPDEQRPFSPPVLQKYDDMQNLLLLDPIHEVDESGWPSPRTEDAGE